MPLLAIDLPSPPGIATAVRELPREGDHKSKPILQVVQLGFANEPLPFEIRILDYQAGGRCALWGVSSAAATFGPVRPSAFSLLPSAN